MNQMNQMIMEAKVARVGELKQTAAGSSVLEFTVANERFYRNARGEPVNEVSYFDVAAFGRMAEYAGAKLQKGSSIRIVGRLKQERWKDNEGKSMSKIKVIAEHLDFMRQQEINPEKTEVNVPPEQDEGWDR